MSSLPHCIAKYWDHNIGFLFCFPSPPRYHLLHDINNYCPHAVQMFVCTFSCNEYMYMYVNIKEWLYGISDTHSDMCTINAHTIDLEQSTCIPQQTFQQLGLHWFLFYFHVHVPVAERAWVWGAIGWWGGPAEGTRGLHHSRETSEWARSEIHHVDWGYVIPVCVCVCVCVWHTRWMVSMVTDVQKLPQYEHHKQHTIILHSLVLMNTAHLVVVVTQLMQRLATQAVVIGTVNKGSQFRLKREV